MTQSRSFNNLLRNSHLKLHHEEPANLYQHLNAFKKAKQRSTTVGADGGKNSSKEYNSSIHQCKPTYSHQASSNQIPRHLTEDCNRFEIKEDVENCITNGSETVSSKFNGTNPLIENGFVTYSNISAVPNTHEDDIVYSSTEGRAAEMISKNQFLNGTESNTHSHKLLPRRYNDSFGQNELRVDTSPSALLLKDICEAACTVKYTNYQNHAMMKDLRKLTGSKSTKNLSTTSFMRPKRTVSINLFPNENEESRKSVDSSTSFTRMQTNTSKNQQDSSKFSTLKKSMRFAQAQKQSYLEAVVSKNQKNFGNRKRTLETNSNLESLSRQLSKTEKTLTSVSRKQSEQMSMIQDRIKVLKSQLEYHKKNESMIEEIHEPKEAKTPNGQGRVKTRNMSKYLQSKSRNNQPSVKASKTQEKNQTQRKHKPFSSLMLKSFSKNVMNSSAASNRKTLPKKMPKYIEKAYKEAIASIGSSSSGREKYSGTESDHDDKTTQRNGKNSNSSHIFTMSEGQEDIEMMYANHYDFPNRDQLMYIQEEQEYTTNEAAEVVVGSTCKCDAEEDKQDCHQIFVNNYCKSNQLQEEDESQIDSEVLLSSPQGYRKVPGYKTAKHKFK